MSISLKPVSGKLQALTVKHEAALLIAIAVILLYLFVCVTVIFIAAEKVTGKYMGVLAENAENLVHFVSLGLSASDSAQLRNQADFFIADKSGKAGFFSDDVRLPDSCRAVYLYFPEKNGSAACYRIWPDIALVLSPAVPLAALEELRKTTGRENLFLFRPGEKRSVRSTDKAAPLLFAFAPPGTGNEAAPALIGVEFSLAGLVSYRQSVIILLLGIFLLPSIAALIFSFALYMRYVKPLQTSSITDSLTGLYNREYFKIQYEKLINSSRRYQSELAIIMLDIDFFKQYNDTYGHQTGDECLKKITRAVKMQANRPLDLVFRYGGEEFIILLPDTNLDGAVNVAKKIKDAVIDLKIEHRGSVVASCVTVSQGIFVLPKNSSASENMYDYIEKADRALYRSKHDGRNRYTVFIAPSDVSSGAPGLTTHVFQSASC